jgi:hypothetical protein
MGSAPRARLNLLAFAVTAGRMDGDGAGLELHYRLRLTRILEGAMETIP